MMKMVFTIMAKNNETSNSIIKVIILTDYKEYI